MVVPRGPLRRLIQAARGAYRPDAAPCNNSQQSSAFGLFREQARKQTIARHTADNCGDGIARPLRCFPLRSEHFGTFEPSHTGRSDSGVHSEDDGSSSSTPPTRLATATPADFHSDLIWRIRGAKRRVKIATLYVGAAGAGAAKSPREAELLSALEEVARRCHATEDEGLELSIVMDACRGLRRVKRTESSGQGTESSDADCDDTTTSSADAVFEHLQRGKRQCGRSAAVSSAKTKYRVECGLYLFSALDEPLRSILPSPLNELAGVMHIKAYVIDDALILSGANLSEEYFTDRQDRYMLFTNGGAGLVDFYARLIGILCQYSHEYDGSPSIHSESNDKKNELFDSLCALFDGTNDELVDDKNVVAFAVPTFQAPRGFFAASARRKLPFSSDTEVTEYLLQTALESDRYASVGVSSAYLNPTPRLMNTLKQFIDESEKNGCVLLVTAGPRSHGFAPKKKADGVNGRGRDWIPAAYAELVNEAALHLLPRGGKVLLYEREGWTFHAKGLWLSSSSTETGRNENFLRGNLIEDPSTLSATIVGSGNYGARSEALDFESNCILVLNQSDYVCTSIDEIRSRVANEWNEMVHHSTEVDLTKQSNAGLGRKTALGLIRKVM